MFVLTWRMDRRRQYGKRPPACCVRGGSYTTNPTQMLRSEYGCLCHPSRPARRKENKKRGVYLSSLISHPAVGGLVERVTSKMKMNSYLLGNGCLSACTIDHPFGAITICRASDEIFSMYRPYCVLLLHRNPSLSCNSRWNRVAIGLLACIPYGFSERLVEHGAVKVPA